MWWYTSSLAIVFFCGLLQQSPLLYVAGVKPNITLAALVVFLSIYKTFSQRVFLIGAAVLSLKFFPGFDIGVALFAAAAVFSALVLDLLPWKRFARVVAAATLGTVIMQFASWDLGVFTKELIMNMLFTGTAFYILSGYVAKSKKKKKRSF